MEAPVINSGPSETWAPGGAEFFGDSLFFAGLRGETLFEAETVGGEVKELRKHFNGMFGRIRDVMKGSDGMLYISTSNRDGRGNPENSDDRIIRINTSVLR